MKNPLRKIILIFITIILLPVFFLIVYELGSLSRNEEMVREIYRNQLDAILYSVNQYSDDVVNSWANKINMASLDSGNQLVNSSAIKALAGQNPSVQSVSISNQDLTNMSLVFVRENFSTDSVLSANRELVTGLKEEIKRLTTYQRGGFRKIEAIEGEGYLIPLIFLLDESNGSKVCVITIDPRLFITNTLAPKMQAISQEKFIISAFNSSDHTMVYATDEDFVPEQVFNSRTDSDTLSNDGKNLQLRDFWLLPEYYLGISMQEETLDELVQGRTKINVFFISVLVVLLLAGIILIYRNIRREILLSQVKSEFVSNVSHEIRTPLSLISMFAETLALDRVKTEEKKKEYYKIIQKETSRLSTIVNRILNFSQMEANKRRYEFVTFNLNELIEEILNTYDFHLENKGFTYSKNFDENLKEIYADREAVSEAIINLLDNAIKYSKDKKQIDISTGQEKGSVYVEVKDYGIGISSSHQKEVFDQFFRVPTGDIHTIKGSGLGLALVKKIMDTHKGEITLDSKLGKGSAFRLYFPINQTTTA